MRPDLSAMGFPTTLTVFSRIQDVTPPALTAFDFAPKTITTTATVTVSFTVTDDVSGATHISARFLSPSGAHFAFGLTSFTATTSQTGSFELDAICPQCTELGTWTVSEVILQDATGNLRFLHTADLSAMGFPTTLTVGP